MTRSNRQRPQKPAVPTFANRDEEAAFWDTHDLTDYFYDFEFKPA